MLCTLACSLLSRGGRCTPNFVCIDRYLCPLSEAPPLDYISQHTSLLRACPVRLRLSGKLFVTLKHQQLFLHSGALNSPSSFCSLSLPPSFLKNCFASFFFSPSPPLYFSYSLHRLPSSVPSVAGFSSSSLYINIHLSHPLSKSFFLPALPLLVLETLKGQSGRITR